MKRIFYVLIAVMSTVSCDEQPSEVIYNASNTSIINGVVCDADERPISGLYREYYLNGNIKMEMESKKGLPEGKGKFYDEEGNLLYEAYFSQGMLNGLVIHYFPNGKVHNEMQFSNGLQDGAQKTYNYDGKLIAEIEYKQGKAISGCIYDGAKKIELTESELQRIN